MSQETITQFCRLEMARLAAEEAYETAAKPLRAQDVAFREDLVRHTRNNGQPWYDLGDGTYLRCATYHDQVPITEDTLCAAATQVRAENERDAPDLALKLLSALKQLRVVENYRIKRETKLPKRVISAPPLEPDLQSIAAKWIENKQEIEMLRKTKQKRLEKCSTSQLLAGGAFNSVPVEGLQLVVNGKNMMIKRYTSTHAGEILERHIKSAVLNEIDMLRQASPNVYASHIMRKIREMAGSKTNEVVTLVECKKRKH